MKLSLILQAIDRASRPVLAVRAATARLGGASRAASADAAHLSQRLGGVTARVRRLVSGPGSLKVLEKVSYGVGFAIGSLSRRLAGLAIGGIGYATAGLTAMLGYLTFGVISTSAKFEVFQAQLEGVEGSAAKARASLAWVRKFAQETPYEVEEVTDAFVKARKQGIDPMAGALQIMGDAASGANKTFADTVEAIIDAQNFEYERLREFNITSSTKGNAVTFSYFDKQGKEVARTFKKTKMSVREGLLGIMREMYSGGMKLRSRTLPGILSNLRDTFTNFQFDVGSAGFYDKVKSKLQSILTLLNRASADGTLLRWARSVSAALSTIVDKAWNFATKTDWQRVGSEVKSVATAFWSIARLIGKTVGLVGKLDNALRSLPQPPGWLGGDPLGKLPQPPRFLGSIERGFKGIFGGGRAAPAMGPRVAPSVRSGPVSRPEPRPGNAKISLHVTTDRGVQVRPTRLATQGVNVEVNTGRAMRGPA